MPQAALRMGDYLKGSLNGGIAREAFTLKIGSRVVQLGLEQWADEDALQPWRFWNFRHNYRESFVSERVDDDGRPVLRRGGHL
jgi:hypothetical protein